MFVQVIQGKVTDAAALEQRMQAWRDGLESSASGFTGSTGGVTADGTAILLACFESEEAARRNSQRPEQDAWWRETEQIFDGPVTFRDTTDVETSLAGPSPEAGFVQIMQGTVRDRDRYRQLTQEAEGGMEEMRPDVLGGLTAWFDGTSYVEAIYFTSEAEARAGERRMNEVEMPESMKEFIDLSQDTSYYDLTSPMIESRS